MSTIKSADPQNIQDVGSSEDYSSENDENENDINEK